MTLSDNLHLGDRLQVAPSWQHGEHNANPVSQTATVVYIHPEGRYCTVRYKDGLTDTVQTVPAERVAHKGEEPEGYRTRVVPVAPMRGTGRHNQDYQGEGRPNKYVRDKLKSLHVSQRKLALSMGRSKGYIDYKLSGPLSKAEQEAIIQAAEKLAAKRSEA